MEAIFFCGSLVAKTEASFGKPKCGLLDRGGKGPRNKIKCLVVSAETKVVEEPPPKKKKKTKSKKENKVVGWRSTVRGQSPKVMAHGNVHFLLPQNNFSTIED